MKLGAQLYSLRDKCETYEDLRQTFRTLKDIGYEIVQVSGIGASITADQVAEASKEFGLPVTCTHTPYDRIVGETAKVIEENRIMGCSEVGIGGLPVALRKDLPTVMDSFNNLHRAAKEIEAAGMKFAFHNHHAEFADMGGTSMYEIMINEYPEFNFIFDVYWAFYAGKDPVEYIHRLKGRIQNIHFKDMATPPQGPICPCGEGCIDLASVYRACLETGIPYAQVEQDNAPESGDSLGQMAISYKNLAPLFKA